MNLRSYLFLFIFFICSIDVYSQAGNKEKIALLQKNFNSINNGGPTWDEFGDLVFEKNNKTYWLSTFCSVVDVAEDYYRLFEIDYSSSSFREVTNEMLGGFYPTGGYNPPYYYEDIDNDGIKDILIIDHGKELSSVPARDWGARNVFFKGTQNGFSKAEIPQITTDTKYYHAHALDDFDRDGDLDIAYGTEFAHIFMNDGKGNFIEQKTLNLINEGPSYVIGSDMYWPNRYGTGTFGLKFVNLDQDKELELLSTVSQQPIYLDYAPNGWTAKLFGKSDSFVWKPNVHIGVEQTLEIPNKKTQKSDLFYRVTTYDYLMEGGSQMKWMTKMFMSKSSNIDSIYYVQNDLSKSNSFFYLDPKLVDLNFDGSPDLFFKEDEFWGNTGQKLHPINQRMWMNDGNNNFSTAKMKFSDDANQLVYIFAKSDSVKKINILFSQRGIPFDKSGKFSQDIRYMYNRIDTIVYPIKNTQSIKLCSGTSLKTVVTKVPVGIVISDHTNASNLVSTGQDFVQIKGNVAGDGVISYKLKNDFFEGEINTIKYTILEKPPLPTITRDGENLVSSNSTGNQWYLDGLKLVGETNNKIKASSTGVYTVQTSNNLGCISDLSKGEYGLITSTLKEDDLGIFPNPFGNHIKVSFPVDFGAFADVKVVDNSGVNRFERKSIKSGDLIDLSFLPNGTFILNLYSPESGKTITSKIVKYH
jgi:hypothetical protein